MSRGQRRAIEKQLRRHGKFALAITALLVIVIGTLMLFPKTESTRYQRVSTSAES